MDRLKLFGVKPLCALLLFAIAAGLRFYELDWGLPDGMATVDERIVWPPRLTAFVRRGFTFETLVTSRLVYPPAVGYLMGLTFWVGTHLGIVDALPVAQGFGGIFLGRIITAVLDLATVPLTGLLAARLYSEREGWIAAALLAVCPLAVGQAHYLSVDPISATVVPIVGLGAVALQRTATARRAVLAGVACGIAFGVKYNALALGILPACSLVAIALRDGVGRAVVLALTVFIAFLATASALCVSCLVYWDKFLTFMQQYLWYVSLGGEATSYGLGRRPYFFLFALPGALGWPAYVAAWLGLGVALVRRRFEDVLVVVGTLTLVLPLASSSQFFLRYLLPALPLLAILGARGLGALPVARRFRSTATAAVIAGGLAISLLWLPTFETDDIVAWADAAPKDRPGTGVLAVNPLGARFGFEWIALEAVGAPRVIVSITGEPNPNQATKGSITLADSCASPIQTLIVPDRIYKFWAATHGILAEPYDERSLFADADCWVKEDRVCRTCTLDEWSPWWWPGRGDYSFGATDFDVYTKRGTSSVAPAPTSHTVEPAQDEAATDDVSGTGRSAERAPAAVFVIMMDTLRADSLLATSDEIPPADGLTRLLRDSMVFTHAYAPSSWTRTSVATLLTGLEPHAHRVYGRLHALDEEAVTLAEALRQEGFATFAWSTNPNILPIWGFGQGFDEFVEVPWEGPKKPAADRVFDDVESLLSSDRSQRALYYIHLMDPHHPYGPDESMLEKADRSAAVRRRQGKGRAIYRLYAASIAHMEQRLGEFVDFLIEKDLYASSLIVLVSDHGEEFEEHGGIRHGKTLYDEVLRVPLVVKPPGAPSAGGVREQPVGLADVMPTVLAELDLPPSTATRGQPLLSGAFDARARFGVLYLDGRSLESVIQDGWKLIVSGDGTEELYDLSTDPGERRNLVQEAPDRAAELRELIRTQRGIDQAGWQIVACAGSEPGVLRFAISGGVASEALRPVSLESDDVLESTAPDRIEVTLRVKPFEPGGTALEGEEWSWGPVLQMSEESMDSIFVEASDLPLVLEGEGATPLRYRLGSSERIETGLRVSLQDVREKSTVSLIQESLCLPYDEVGAAPYLSLKYVPDPVAITPSGVDPGTIERLKLLGYHW